MDRKTKSDLLVRYVSTLENKYGSITVAEENGDELFEEMREFIKLHVNEESSKRGRGRRWTEEEEQYLIQHYSKKKSADIAIELNRSKESVKNKAYMMGITNKQNS